MGPDRLKRPKVCEMPEATEAPQVTIFWTDSLKILYGIFQV
jgi:hypothetical protein